MLPPALSWLADAAFRAYCTATESRYIPLREASSSSQTWMAELTEAIVRARENGATLNEAAEAVEQAYTEYCKRVRIPRAPEPEYERTVALAMARAVIAMQDAMKGG